MPVCRGVGGGPAGCCANKTSVSNEPKSDGPDNAAGGAASLMLTPGGSLARGCDPPLAVGITMIVKYVSLRNPRITPPWRHTSTAKGEKGMELNAEDRRRTGGGNGDEGGRYIVNRHARCNETPG